MAEALFISMAQAIVDGEAETAADLARQALEQGIDPLDAINKGFALGVNFVGDEFSCGQIFLPDLALAGDAMRAAVAVLEPEMTRRGMTHASLGTIVIGTVHGDIHDIGKTLVASMLSAAGFKVHDLGTNISAQKFVEKAVEVKAEIIAASALLSTTMLHQREIVRRVEKAGLRGQIKVLVGGAPVTQGWADEIGADGYGADAVAAVAAAKRLRNL